MNSNEVWNYSEGVTNDGVDVWWIHRGEFPYPENRVCKVPRTFIRKDAEITNARIISAAPELLAALEYSLEFLVVNDDGESDVVDRISSAKAAIAKARNGD